MTQQDTQPPAETRDRLTHDEQMQDAQKGCAPCALCGGRAIINDAGSGAGYFIRCSNSQIFKASEGCLIEQRRLGGWAYNVMDWWNRLHTAALTRRAGGDAIPAAEVVVPRVATRAMVDAADACPDAYSAWAAMVEASHVR
ncbi:hypothetical protein [Sphingomonas carotinifaciens]|uniref:hypothetical protein n=1 Tax=Sphingomonas carotinifaciens TaxID=1166323 RepID=UPI001237523C|nr:hypothetical protein [Sphingomonas carotinifaciens]